MSVASRAAAGSGFFTETKGHPESQTEEVLPTGRRSSTLRLDKIAEDFGGLASGPATTTNNDTNNNDKKDQKDDRGGSRGRVE